MSRKEIEDIILGIKKLGEVAAEMCFGSMLETNGLLLKYINNQNDRLCLIAVKQNPNALKYVKNRTDNIASQAIMFRSS